MNPRNLKLARNPLFGIKPTYSERLRGIRIDAARARQIMASPISSSFAIAYESAEPVATMLNRALGSRWLVALRMLGLGGGDW